MKVAGAMLAARSVMAPPEALMEGFEAIAGGRELPKVRLPDVPVVTAGLRLMVPDVLRMVVLTCGKLIAWAQS